MKKFITPALLCAGLIPTLTHAQLVDRTKYPDYSSEIRPDYSLLQNGSISKSKVARAAEADPLPDHYNNAETKYFPPVFNQDGGSCGSASRICYMFTHELNSFRDADAKLLSNRYPSHFVWLLTNGNSGKDEFVQFVGVPSAEVYGGTTYSALFGNQDTSQDHFGWMQGYDKWYSGMWNRMWAPGHFPMSVQSEEGREMVKRWLYNHNGDTDFHSGGLAGIGVASGGDWQRIPKTPANDEAGVSGQYYVESWGQQVDHALTIVGYDDRIEFDLDHNGVKGEKDKDEVGAWIVVNSWSDGWCNKGFIYCPYKHAGPVGKGQGGYWQPEIYKVRKNYRPLRTIKIEMEYSRRSEIRLSAGVSSNLEATEPEATLIFDHFKYAGDGANGNTRPAPEIPMLGRWADGKLHDEPMEFGYDLTDLSASFDKNMPLKYFFIVEPRNWAEGTGKIHNASIIDYEFDKEGVETPFQLNGGIEIQNKGKKTIISTIVYGESYYAPVNLSLVGNQLSWNAPLRSSHDIKNYRVYRDGVTLADLAPQVLSYELTETVGTATYSVAAVYEDGVTSAKVNVNTPITLPEVNQTVNFDHTGFTIPGVFGSKFDEATIEYWLKPNSVTNYNQQVGPGWGTFLLHANVNGAMTVGWDTSNRTNSSAGKINKGRWVHVAVVVKKNHMTLYLNGAKASEFTSNQYSGIGGFGNLVFHNEDTDATIDEIHIWNYAREKMEIMRGRNVEFSGNILPSGLIAYYKGDTFTANGKSYLREYISGNHAEIMGNGFKQQDDTSLDLRAPKSSDLSVKILPPMGTVFTGIPVEFNVEYAGVSNILWSAPDANIKDLQIISPTLTFQNAGEQMVFVTGTSAEGEVKKDSCVIKVEETPAPDATFTPTKSRISADERVTFIVNHPMVGYRYNWDMPGAEIETSKRTNCAANYTQQGEYTVTLTVTAPNGKTATSSQTISVVEVAPIAAFDIAPAVILKGETTFLKDKSRYTPNQWQWLIHGGSKDIIINGQNSSLTMDIPGVYDVTLTAKNSTGSNSFIRERALVVCNADSKSGLNFTRDDAQVKLTRNPFDNNSRRATIEWWMKPASLSAVCCGMGEEGTLSLRATMDGSVTLFTSNNKVPTPAGYITAGEWHHYAIVFMGSQIQFYKDGERFFSKSISFPALSDIKEFSISNSTAPFKGQIDEFRIWNTAFNESKIQQYANAPIENIEKAIAEDKLALYYDFNQNSGNVKDLTGNNNHGIRTNFGPDGDAWGLSKGVFCLNFGGTAENQNVTSSYLKNFRKAFKKDGNNIVNPSAGSRFAAIADWILENAKTEGRITTSVHVDSQKDNCFTFTAGWDSFSDMTNHKAYQTITLPAGSYTFTAKYGNYEGVCGNTYLVAATGKGLPNTIDLGSSLAFQKMEPKSNTHMSNSLHFVLAEETEISLGLLINLNGKNCCTISEFQLNQSPIEMYEADGANGYDLTIDGTGHSTLFLPYPTLVPEGTNAYVAKEIKESTIVLEPVANGIVPARTGVVVTADAGTYHFDPSAVAGSQSSLLQGVLENTEVDATKRYYSFDAQDKPAFYLFNGSTLEANRAYLVRESNDSNEVYYVEFNQTGIDAIEGEETPAEVYDLSGRRVLQPNKGVYIYNGKKILVK